MLCHDRNYVKRYQNHNAATEYDNFEKVFNDIPNCNIVLWDFGLTKLIFFGEGRLTLFFLIYQKLKKKKNN